MYASKCKGEQKHLQSYLSFQLISVVNDKTDKYNSVANLSHTIGYLDVIYMYRT